MTHNQIPRLTHRRNKEMWIDPRLVLYCDQWIFMQVTLIVRFTNKDRRDAIKTCASFCDLWIFIRYRDIQTKQLTNQQNQQRLDRWKACIHCMTMNVCTNFSLRNQPIKWRDRFYICINSEYSYILNWQISRNSFNLRVTDISIFNLLLISYHQVLMMSYIPLVTFLCKST